MNTQRLKMVHKGSKNTCETVLYWMQATQRVDDNAGLNAAISYANRYDKSLTVIFNIVENYPEANQRHYTFMLENIEKVGYKLADKGIEFVVTLGDFSVTLNPYLKAAFALVTDYPYGDYLKSVYKTIINTAKTLDIDVLQAESNVIVPVALASQKSEYGARTIRPKLLRLKDDFLVLEKMPTIARKSNTFFTGFKPTLSDFIKQLNIDQSVLKSPVFTGGEDEGLKRLNHFIENNLNDYQHSNDPSKQLNSTLSPYLHFGQISPVRIYLSVEEACDIHNKDRVSCENYLEQLLVRRELGFNYMHYHKGYDCFETMTEPWAYQTMSVHLGDLRDTIYTIKDYLGFKTHDVYFNAAMKEMVYTGYMHNYMRMYWAKKIIEWSPNYAMAYETIKTLNNTYFLDGRDANSYASIAWCFGKHDRAWTERDIFGKLRYMNAAGLKRKFNIDAYVAHTNTLKNL